MSEMSIVPEPLRAAGSSIRAQGAEVLAHGVVGQIETAALAPVFGLIGADFLAAAAGVINHHDQQVKLIGQRYLAAGDGITTAVDTFQATDDGSANRLSL